jgi:hypothetical protein
VLIKLLLLYKTIFYELSSYYTILYYTIRMKFITKARRFGYTRRRSLSVYTRTLRVSAAADFFRSRSRFDDDFFSHRYQSFCDDDYYRYSWSSRNTVAGGIALELAFALEPRANTPSRNRKSRAIKRFVPSSPAFPTSE